MLNRKLTKIIGRSAGSEPASGIDFLIYGDYTQDLSVGDTFTLVVYQTYGYGGTVTFDISGIPAWATFDYATGGLTGVLTQGDFIDIIITATLTLNGAVIATSALGPFEVHGLSIPELTGTPQAEIYPSVAYTFTPTVTGIGSNVLTWTIENGPSALTVNSSGVVSGTISPSLTRRVYPNVTLRATDGYFNLQLSWTLTRVPDNYKPTIIGEPATQVVTGVQYRFTPTAADLNDDTLTFSGSNLPPTATVNSATGEFVWTPSGTGTYPNVTITVHDGTAYTIDPLVFTIESVSGASWTPPSISSHTIPTFTYNTLKAITKAMFVYSFSPLSAEGNISIEVQDGTNYTHTLNDVTPNADYDSYLNDGVESPMTLNVKIIDNNSGASGYISPGSSLAPVGVLVSRDTFESLNASFTTALTAAATYTNNESVPITVETTLPAPEFSSKGVLVRSAVTNHARWNYETGHTNTTTGLPDQGMMNASWNAINLATKTLAVDADGDSYYRMYFPTTGAFIRQTNGGSLASTISDTAASNTYTNSALFRCSAENTADTVDLLLYYPDGTNALNGVTPTPFTLQKGGWQGFEGQYSRSGPGINKTGTQVSGSLVFKFAAGSAGSYIDVLYPMQVPGTFRKGTVLTLGAEDVGLAELVKLYPVDLPGNEVSIKLTVDIVARPTAEVCLFWVGTDANNGAGLFLSPAGGIYTYGGLIFKKYTGTVAKGSCGYAFPDLISSTFNVEMVQQSTGMKLIVDNSATPVTDTSLAAQDPIAVSTYLTDAWVGCGPSSQADSYVRNLVIGDVSATQPTLSMSSATKYVNAATGIAAQTVRVAYNDTVSGVPVCNMRFYRGLTGTTWTVGVDCEEITPNIATTSLNHNDVGYTPKTYNDYTFAALTFTASHLIKCDLVADKSCKLNHWYAENSTVTSSWTDIVNNGMGSYVEGMLTRYTWSSIEPTTQGNYQFGAIQTDLDYAAANGFKLLIAVSVKTFSSSYTAGASTVQYGTDPFPSWMLEQTASNQDNHFSKFGPSSFDASGNPVGTWGYGPLVWKTSYRDAYKSLISALLTQFRDHAGFGGIFMLETATGFNNAQSTMTNYVAVTASTSIATEIANRETVKTYVAGLIDLAKYVGLRNTRGRTIQFFNQIAGASSLIGKIMDENFKWGVLPGGPDILQYSTSLNSANRVYEFTRERFGKMPTTISGQHDTLREDRRNGSVNGGTQSAYWIDGSEQCDWAIGATSAGGLVGNASTGTAGSVKTPKVPGLGCSGIFWNKTLQSGSRPNQTWLGGTFGGTTYGGSKTRIIEHAGNDLNAAQAKLDHIRKSSVSTVYCAAGNVVAS